MMVEKLASSPNRSTRTARVSAVVMHTTGSESCRGTLDWFQNPDSQVSSHVVIDLDGWIYRVVSDDLSAWHAGKSLLHQQASVNNFSLGVELVGKKPVNYPPAQLDAAARWVAEACKKHQIPLNRIVGHADVAIPHGRKTDPENFPWSSFLLQVAKYAA